MSDSEDGLYFLRFVGRGIESAALGVTANGCENREYATHPGAERHAWWVVALSAWMFTRACKCLSIHYACQSATDAQFRGEE